MNFVDPRRSVGTGHGLSNARDILRTDSSVRPSGAVNPRETDWSQCTISYHHQLYPS